MAYLSPIGNYGSYGVTYPPQAALQRPGSVGIQSSAVNDEKLKASGQECQTCKERQYQDGSDEMVSFKSPTHIAPQQAATAVRAHEQEHVSNAYSEAATKGGEVVRASVTIHTSICPECGRSYVSGGTTSTQIKYNNEENPYQKDLKLADQIRYKGMNADYSL